MGNNKKLVVYCHGYGSSANTDKLQILRDAGIDAYCFDADIDPDVAFRNICENVDMLLIDHLNDDLDLIFVGTSLGGWMASKLAAVYLADAIIINPSYDPSTSLKKYGVPFQITQKYTKLQVKPWFDFVFAENDEVIDHSACIEECKKVGAPITMVPNADHRFNTHFGMIVDKLKKDLTDVL